MRLLILLVWLLSAVIIFILRKKILIDPMGLIKEIFMTLIIVDANAQKQKQKQKNIIFCFWKKF